jgi:glycosyltransferase involved in cell wall biosynthesis
MKIAIFHNFMDNIGGAERVGLILARELKADLYSTNFDEQKMSLMGFSDINCYSIGRVPINAPLRQQLAFWRFRYLNIPKQFGKKYDYYIIDGDWAMSGAFNHHPNLWYIHSPIREIWDLYQHTRNHTVPFMGRYLFDAWVLYNRAQNRKLISSVDKMVCNSMTTKARVERFLGREDAVVIHPPVDTTLFREDRHGRGTGYWLSVNRLISHKQIHIQLEAFRELPDEKLIIVGSYERSRHFLAYANELQSNLPANVEIRSFIPQAELIDLYSRCKGVLCTSKEEDFGLSAVEAFASGKPVIANAEGGYLETVIPGQTGILLPRLDKEDLRRAIVTLGPQVHSYRERTLLKAKEYDTTQFIAKIKNHMSES